MKLISTLMIIGLAILSGCMTFQDYIAPEEFAQMKQNPKNSDVGYLGLTSLYLVKKDLNIRANYSLTLKNSQGKTLRVSTLKDPRTVAKSGNQSPEPQALVFNVPAGTYTLSELEVHIGSIRRGHSVWRAQTFPIDIRSRLTEPIVIERGTFTHAFVLLIKIAIEMKSSVLYSSASTKLLLEEPNAFIWQSYFDVFKGLKKNYLISKEGGQIETVSF